MSSELSDPPQKPGWRSVLTTQRLILGSLLLSIALWTVSLPRIDLDAMEDIGLVSVLPVTVFVSLSVLVLGFVASVFRPGVSDRIWKTYVVTFIAFLHGTPALLYGTLRYPWGWKHVGVIDYIQRHGTVDPNVDSLSVYHNWPGFFSMNAFFTEASGFDSALSYASWAPLFFNLAVFVVLLLIVDSLTDDRRVVAFSIWFYFLTSWVGQDYFAPQALTFLLYLVIVAIVFRWYRSGPLTTESHPTGVTTSERFRRSRYGWIVSLRRGPMWRIPVEQDPETMDEQTERLTAGQRKGLVAFLLLLMFVIASSHQLSPLMTILALVALAFVGLARPWSLAVPMVAATLLWSVTAAESFVRRNLDDLAESGRFIGNVQGSLVDLDQVSDGQVLVSWMSRGLTVLIVLLALAGLARSHRHRRWHTAALTLMAAPVSLAVLSSYGSEILFRMFMFSLPFAAFLAALVLFPAKAVGASRRTQVAAVGISLTLLLGFVFAYYGNEHLNYFTPAEVNAADYLYETAPKGSLIVEGSRSYPGLSRNHEFFVYVPIAREPWETRIDLVADPVPRLTRWLTDDHYPASYLIITRSQKVQTESQGEMPPDGLERIESVLRQSPEFEVWFSNEDATIFVAAESGAES